ncbi:MAG: T9SS type A sorting domain-containing protein, partial [Bacteroidales bacterium]|nr:T9SS type A sorting domain-containing protein [Bacteroidales bacterium]
LTPFVKEPSALIANFNSEIIIGASSFEVSTEEDAFVAISLNGILLDAKISGADGLVNLAFSPLTEVDIAKLVITKQNRIPKIVDISIIPSTTPYVIKENITINDEVGGNNNGVIDYGEQIKLSITLKNVSDTYDALSVEAKLYCADTNIKIIDSLENFGTILKDTVSLKNNSYLFQVKDSIIDQHSFQLTFLVTGNDSDGNPYTWTSKESLIINAPKLELGDLIVDDSEFNGNGILDPGETATLKQLVKNIGHAGISGLTGLIEYVSGSTLFTIDQSTTSAFELAAGSTDTISFIVTASASELIGTAVELKITIVDNTIDFYTISGNETIIIGEIPEYNISAGGKIPVFNTTLFYDSGGPAANYGDRENYKITFVPKQETGYLKVTFNSFDVELNSSGGCYDKLFIYNDTTNNEAKKIGEFCSNNPPTEFEANNASGALTFVFTSDASVVKTGWEAEINFVQNNAVTFIVSASGNPIENALISFNNQEKYTNSTGEAIFDNIRPNSQLNYEIRKIGYENESGTINVTSDIVKTVELTVGIPNYTVKFNVIDGSTAINGASITFDGLTRVTATDGSCTFDSVEYGLNKKYTITKDKYYQYTDSVDVDSNLVENVSMTLITFNITFLVTSNENSGPLEDVIVAFNSENKITNSEGIAIFNNVSPKSGIAYSLTKTGYTTITGTLDVANENKSVSFAMSVVSSVNDIMPGEVSVFPNPSQGIINIRFEERKENIQINVYDVIGKSVFTKTLPQIENIEIIDLTNQPKGLYFVSIKSGDGEVISKKILIK